ncbi:MAG: PKD domain-containing protein [Acidobacteria bacterium]|nr:PKD domain-containing protein [Acidobacteriota bacterium]
MNRRTLAFLICGTLAPPALAAAGTVNGVSVAPASAVAGTPVSVTVTGTNPCGAAHIHYGDGEAVTYAITGLPTAQTHAYNKPGAYTITATGMGNCDGQATTTVTITAPPAPPPPSPAAPRITSVEMVPRPGRVGDPVAITVNGTGSCSYEVHYGDGNAQEVTGSLPQQFKHTYGRADTFTVIVKPTPPCSGKFTEQLQVLDRDAGIPRIVRLLVAPAPVDAGQPVSIAVEGTGACGYTMDYGDGNSEPRSGELPQRLRHTYNAPGTYMLIATPDAPCTGAGRVRLVVRGSSAEAGVSAIEVTPNPVPANRPVNILIEGAGNCRVAIDFGDGNTQTVSGTLPRAVSHVYAAPRRYAIEAQAEAPCTGRTHAEVEVRRRRR